MLRLPDHRGVPHEAHHYHGASGVVGSSCACVGVAIKRARGVQIAERTVTHLLYRYEELVAVHLADQRRLHGQFKEQGQIVLAIDGLQPDVGHEALWVLRDCLSGEVLLARSLLSACEADLAHLIREVQEAIDIPIRGGISDGQRSLRNAVQTMLPDIPHQLCHLHYRQRKQPNRCTKPTNMRKKN